jgi:CRP/FNR family transcriptional regulator, anaerobic regulatory protein
MAKQVTFNQAWQGNADCMQCSLRDSALFNGLTEEDFKLIHEPVEQLTIKPGDVVYTAGDQGQYLYTIRSGLVKLVQSLADGTQRIVRLNRNTDVLGMELLVGDSYDHNAIALRSTELCRYPKEAVSVLSRKNPVLHKDLMVRWQKALSIADTWLTHLSTGTAKRRMAGLLLLLVEDDSNECYLFSREDIGSILSITVETASRTISEFKRLNLIKEIRSNHFKLDVEGLNKLLKS